MVILTVALSAVPGARYRWSISNAPENAVLCLRLSQRFLRARVRRSARCSLVLCFTQRITVATMAPQNGTDVKTASGIRIHCGVGGILCIYTRDARQKQDKAAQTICSCMERLMQGRKTEAAKRNAALAKKQTFLSGALSNFLAHFGIPKGHAITGTVNAASYQCAAPRLWVRLSDP